MPKGIGYAKAGKMMAKGRKAKADNKNLKKKKKKSKDKTLVGRAKRQIKNRTSKIDQALRDAGISEKEINRLKGGK